MKLSKKLRKKIKKRILIVLCLVATVLSVFAIEKRINVSDKIAKQIEQIKLNISQIGADETASTFGVQESSSQTSSNESSSLGVGNTVTPRLTGVSIDTDGAVLCDSIVQGVRDSNLSNGNYIFRVTGNNGTADETIDYPVELINVSGNTHYTINDGVQTLDEDGNVTGTTISLGDETTDHKMLVVKYNGNLTIDEGVKVTATNVEELTYKKGMYLCVMGELQNNGEISMTARGTYNQQGENVYLWKNKDNSFEYIPAEGGPGGASKARSSRGTSAGDAGNDGIKRATGGGGSGTIIFEKTNSSGGSGTKRSGAGATGTSYSGGSGGGGLNAHQTVTISAGSGAANGGAGGNGYAGRAKTSLPVRGAGGGAGNLGGLGKYTASGQTTGGNNKAYNGENGTGGLLVIYSKALQNNGKFTSNGSKGGIGGAGGGSSGGGSINLFTIRNNYSGNISTGGGVSVQNSGKGGTGSKITMSTLPDLVIPEKQINIDVGNTYQIDKSKLQYVDANLLESNTLSVGTIVMQSIDTSVATVDNNGNVKGVKRGRTKVKITDTTNNMSTYVYVNVKQGIVPQLEEGNNFTIALKQDGTVWSYGLNGVGQLGLGDNDNRKLPTQITTLSNIKQIATGYSHSMALDNNGNVYTWGLNNNGQIGDGTKTNTNVPLQITGLQNIVKIDCYKNISIALSQSGAVYYWGAGYGTTPTEWLLPSEKIIDISGTILLSDIGKVYNITDPDYQSKSVDYLSNIAKISCGETHSLALTTDGVAYVFGTRTYGEGGLDTVGVVAVGENICNISAGNGTSMLQSNDGKVYVLGNNTNGQIGLTDVTKTNESTLIDIGVKAYDVSAGEGTHCGIIDEKGFIWHSGLNSYGELAIEHVRSVNKFTRTTDIVRLNVKNEYIKINDTINIDVLYAYSFNVINDKTPIQSEWEWTSSNEDVASIDADGIVTGKSIGTTTITGYNKLDGFKARAIINVYNNKTGAITLPQVEYGDSFTVVLKEDGTVWASGQNDKYQLGQGDTDNRKLPVQVKIDSTTYLNNVRKISVGQECTIAMTVDGDVYAWGYGANGRLSQGDTANQPYAIKMKKDATTDIANAIDISAGNVHNMILDGDGKVYVVGSNANYQNLTTGKEATVSYFVDTNLNDIIKLTAGYSTCGAMQSNGQTLAWGNNAYGGLEEQSNPTLEYVMATDAVNISLDGYSTIIQREDGSIWVTGRNNVGQLGLGDTTQRTLLEKLPLPVDSNGSTVKIKQFVSSGSEMMLLTTDGRVYVTGYNAFGQLCDGTTTNATSLKELANNDASQVTDGLFLAGLGENSTYNTTSRGLALIRQDGTVWVVGDNTWGQLGNETNTSSTVLLVFGGSKVELNSRNEYIKIGDTLDIDVLSAQGFNVFIQDAMQQSDWIWKSSNEDVASIDVSTGTITGKSIGSTTITGYNNKNGIKARAIINVYNNKQGAVTIPQVEYGDTFTAILKEDGTVWATGVNGNGQLAQGDTDTRKIPVQVKIDANTYLSNVRKIAVGREHTIAMTVNGDVYAWGNGGNGKLSQGDTENQLYAVKMKKDATTDMEHVIDIAAGNLHSAVVTSDGKVHVVGNNAYYQNLTTGKEATVSYFVDTQLDGAIKLTAGMWNCGAMISNGNTMAWGINQVGALEAQASPSLQYVMATDAIDISLNGRSTIIQREDGSIWVTGQNNAGQLGLGDTTARKVLTKIDLPLDSNGSSIKVKQAVGSGASMMLLTNEGKVYVTGYNGYGQLCNGTTTNVKTLIPLVNQDGTEVTDALLLTNFGENTSYNQYSSGTYTTTQRGIALIRQNGTVWTAGNNNWGQKGDETTTATKYLSKMGIDEVKLNAQNEYMKIGDILDIDVLFSSDFNVFVKPVSQSDWTWISSNEDVATIDNNGIVTANAIGNTTITGYSKDGLKARAIINVYNNIQGAITLPQVAYGDTFTVVLKEDGTVWATGHNNVGQLGQGDANDKNIPVQVKIDSTTYLTNVRKIAVGREHAIAMTVDGDVYAWGYAENGKLAQGNTTKQEYAVKMKKDANTYMEDVIDIAVGNLNSMVVTRDGRCFIVGSNAHYQNLTTGKETTVSYFKDIGVQNIIKTTSGYQTCGAMLSNGDTIAWGQNSNGELEGQSNPSLKYTIAKDAIDISIDGHSTFIQREDGSIWVAGLNDSGQLGLGDTTKRTVLTKVDLPLDSNGNAIKVKQLASNGYTTMLLTKEGKVYVTGYNKYGQLCDGTTTNSKTLIPLVNKDETEVTDALFLADLGENNSTYTTTQRGIALIRQDGTIWLAGNNTWGQIGNSTNTTTKYLTKMGDGFLNYPKKNIVLNVNGTEQINSSLFSLEDDINVFVNNNATLGTINYQIEDNTIATIDTNGLVTGVTQGITKVQVTDSNTGVTTYIWVKVVNEQNIKVDLGTRFSVALKQDGTVWTWGRNQNCQLGLGNKTNYKEPQQVTGITEKIIDVAAGNGHAIALTNNKEVYAWGYNYYGQVGNGTKTNVINPIKIEDLTNIVQIDAYKYMSIALNSDGEVYVWGQGYGTKPRKLNLSRKVIDVAGNIILAENRRAYDLKEKKSYGTDLIKISAGSNHYLGLTAEGKVIAWGTNKYGQLGNGTNTSSSIPVDVVTPDGKGILENIVEISAGNQYSIVSDKDGNVYTFGDNTNNKLGSGVTRNKPELVSGLPKIELVATSENSHTAIVDWDGFVYTVGLNDYGQLGLKDKTDRSTFEMIGEFEIECTPNKIVLNVGTTQNISLSLTTSFSLKTNNQNMNIINTSIANESIASLAGNTITANRIGKTILNASYSGVMGSVNTDIKQYYRNIEIEVLPQGGTVVPKVESGNGFTTSLKADGTVWTWGQNIYGQLGIGNTDLYNEPQKVTIIKGTITNSDGTITNVEETIKDIAVGNYHVLALGETGKVYAWGLGNCGQIGIGKTYNQYTPVVVTNLSGEELTDIVKIEAHEEISFAITSKGEVYAWGKGYQGRAQKLDTIDNVIDVTSKYVLAGDGKVYNIATKDAFGITDIIVDLDEGTDHTVMLTNTGKAYSIGDNTYGQLADGTNVSSTDTLVEVKKTATDVFTDIKEIKAGDKNTVIVQNDGSVWVSGINDNYELGIDNSQTLDKSLPLQNTNISNAIFATAGDNHITVIKDDGSVYAWGNGKLGQLGNRKNSNSINPVMVGDYIVRTNTNKVVLGINDDAIIEGNVEYFNIFNSSAINITYNTKDQTVASLLTPLHGEVTPGKIGIKVVGQKVGTTIVTANQDGTSNIGVIQVEVIPQDTTIEPNVITNGSHTITLRVDGKIYTYGDNTYGQLGNGTTVTSDEPVEVKFPDGTSIIQIAAGENHNVALDKDGNVWTWGRNNNYQLGISSGDQYTPYKVTGLPKVIRIATGNNSTMVLTENNELYAWGLNAYGNLGLGNYTNKVLPTKVIGIQDIIDLSGGKNHFTILNRAGEVFTTGSNLYGQLGITTRIIDKINEFTKVDISEKIGTISSGDLSNIATTVDGEVYVWGSNIYGQLGTGDKSNKNTPVKLSGIRDIREVDAGQTHTIIRDGNQKVYVTGSNSYGQLGLGNKDSKTIFEENTKINNVMRISAGETYTVMLKEDGFVWACGDYNHGDRTKKSRTNSKVPIRVGNDVSSLGNIEMVIMKDDTKSIITNAKFKFNLIYIDKNDTSKFKYESYNTNIAQVNNKGDVLGVKEGTTWIKVTDGNTGKEHVIIIRVVDNNSEYTTHVAPKVSAGEKFAIGLKEDGTIWTWGYDSSQLADSNIPANANMIATYETVDAGKNFAIATRADGTVWTIGNNKYGQLGIGNNDNKSKLVQIEGVTYIKQVAAGDTHALALDDLGIVYGWGSNADGELSTEYVGQDTTSPVVITIPNEKIIQVAAGKNQSVFTTITGKVYGMGSFLNGYILGIDDAVKVDVGDNYILILRKDGTIYKYQYNRLVKMPNASNAVDISVKDKISMYQDVNEIAYAWGVNTYGQLGDNSTATSVVPVQPSNNSTDVFGIGAGYNNTFITSNTGFVYSAGNNTYGELGNGTSGNTNSSTGIQSLTHTLVGDRKFEVIPETKILELNEKENLTLKTNIFNVFRDKTRNLSDYTWISKDPTIVTVLSDGEIQGINLGTTNVEVQDRVTGETKEIIRAVVPVDTDRIDSITASAKQAYVVGAYQYEVKIPKDPTKKTSQVIIKTKLGTDQISIDGGTTWVTGTLTANIDVTNNPTTVPFIVRTEAGNDINYTLNVINQSDDNSVLGVQVTNSGIQKQVTQANNTTYEVILPTTGANTVDIEAQDANAYVSIDGQVKTLKKQTYNFNMTSKVEQIPFKVISESGKVEKYNLIAYAEDYVATLDKVYVNGDLATKTGPKDYEITISDQINLSKVKAIAKVATTKVGINGSAKQITQIEENIQTTIPQIIVTIEVESSDGTVTDQYTLTINRVKFPNDNCTINQIAVNELLGNPDIIANVVQKQKDTYEVQLQNPVNTVDIIASTVEATSEIKILNDTYTTQNARKQIILNSSETEVIITVKSEKGTEKNYTLIIKTLSDVTDLQTITVNGITAVYNKVLGRYEARVNKNLTQYDIIATTKDVSATLAIDNAIPTGNSSATINTVTSIGTINATTNKIGPTTIVPIKVTALNSITQNIYDLAIVEQSSIADIETVEVNGVEIMPQASGNYIIDINSTTNKAKIHVKPENEYAQVTVDGVTKVSDVTITRDITQRTTVYNIDVLAEDGVTTVSKTLTITKLNGNTDITSVDIKTSTSTLPATLQTTGDYIGSYYCKIPRENAVDVTVTLADALASVSIEGAPNQLQTDTQNVTLLNDITEITAIIEAEDGTQLPIEIVIEKESNDTNLLKITSADAMKISNLGSNKYEMQVDSRATVININAITKDANASLKLGTNTTYAKHQITNEPIDTTTISSFTIDVLAEDGITTATYTVQITKKFSTKIANITTDTELATNSGNVYNGWINSDNTADIVVTSDNPLATVNIYKNATLLGTGTGVATIADTVTTQTSTYKVEVLGPNVESSIYVLNVTKKSTNNTIEYVKVEGDTITETTAINTYDATVTSTKTGKYTLEIKAQDKYATIKLDNGTFSTTNIVTEQYAIAPGETREVIVTVKSQDGGDITKKVRISRKDNNLDVQTIEVTANGTTQNITASYDKVHKNYSVTLDNTITTADIGILLESAKANIETTIDGKTYKVVQQLNVTGISLPGVGKKVIAFKVISEEGTQETRTITISQFSSNVELEKVTVNGEVAKQRVDKDYEITIDDTNDLAVVFAQTLDATSSVSINGEKALVSKATVNVNNIKSAAGTTIQIPIVVTSADNSQYTYTLYITVKSIDNAVLSVKVNGNEATKLDSTTYRMFVEKNATQKQVDIEAVSASAVVNSQGQQGNPISFSQTLTNERTEIKFDITSESGKTQKYTLQIIKESDDNTISNVYVNGTEVTKDPATGRYKATVKETEGNPTVKVVTNNEFAYIRIGLANETQGEQTEVVTLDTTKITTVPITIRSQTGVTNVEYLDIERVYEATAIDTIVVDGKEITTYDSTTKTYTATVDSKINIHEMFIMCANSYVTIDTNGDTGIGNVTTYIARGVNEYEKDIKVKVTGESGEIEEYTVKLITKSNNTKLSQILINDIIATPESNRPDIYKRKIKKLDEKAKIKVIAENSKANIKIGDCSSQIGTSEQWVNLNLLEGTITIPVIVTATDGETIATYNIILTRASNDASLFSVVVDGQTITIGADGIYHATTPGSQSQSNVIATATDLNAKVEINTASNLGVLSTNVGLPIIKNIYTIKVTAEDGTEQNYTLEIIRKTQIEGKILTENVNGQHKSQITVYKTADTRAEYDPTNAREVIKQVETNIDGTFIIDIEDIEKYDVLVTKPGYLDYRVIKIQAKAGEKITLDDYKLIAGDVVKTGEIEIDDLVRIGEHYGTVTVANQATEEKYDFTGDAKIDKADRNILKKNYGKKAETIEWVDPNPLPVAVMTLRTRVKTKGSEEEKDEEEGGDEQENSNESNISTTAIEVTAEDEKLILPLKTKYKITSPYGMRVHPTTGEKKKHTGIDLVGPHHGEIIAIADGEVVFSGVNTAFGNCIEIKHTYKGKTIYSFYAHLSRRDVKVGYKVVQGQVIGLEGGASTDENHGWSTGHHLHFEIRKASGYGNDVNPNDYFDF